MLQRLPYHPNPFGSVMQGRNWTDVNRNYRYGFNAKEKDKEGMGGGGSTYDYGFRIYNASLGRFLSVDPISSYFPWNGTYNYAENSPISGIDLDGLEFIYAADGTFLRQGDDKSDLSVLCEEEVIELVIVGYTYTLEKINYSNSDISSCCNQPKYYLKATPIYEEKVVKKTTFVHKDHDMFLKLAGWTYNENTRDPWSQKANLGMLNNRASAKELYYGFDNINSIDDALMQIINKKREKILADCFRNMRLFINSSFTQRNSTKGMKSAVAAAIYVLRGGADLSNGAIFEHGQDFFIHDPDYPRANRERLDKGWTFVVGGEFKGDFNPVSYPEQEGAKYSSSRFIITATNGKNVYCKPSPQKTP